MFVKFMLFPRLFPMAVALLLLVAAGLPGCSTTTGPVRQPEIAEPSSLSDQARATYAYLHYLQLSGDEAMQALNTALELDPNPELFQEKIHRLWKDNKYLQAEKTARKGLSVFPQHPSLTLALIRTLLAQDKDDQAMDLVHTILDRHPGDWSLRLRLGRILLQERLPSQALSVLQAIPEKARSANTHYFLAQANDAMDNRRKTIHHLEQATRLNPTFHKAWAELGYQYELSRDFVAAKKAYSTLLDLGETSPDILLRLIEINLKLNNPNQALQVLTSRISQPEVVLSGIGLFVNNGFYELALQALQDFGPQIANSPRGFLYRAVLVWELNSDLDQALVLLRQIPESSELHPRALALRCQLLWEKGSPS
ncbi:MAG: tetratricopeptide repeat protein, partial [Desulfovermiculus sp.]|nr:tetratricopeptide repeat protein [Desulfovermiculus sp.]